MTAACGETPVAASLPETPATTADGAAPEHELLDESVLREMRETLGEDTVRLVVATFARGADTFAAELRDGVAGGDPVAVAAKLHRMVGSAAAVGASRLARICRGNEVRLRAMPPGVGETAVDVEAIEQILSRTRSALGVHLEAFQGDPAAG